MKPRQRRGGLADELPRLLAHLPWWCIPIVVAIVYFGALRLLPALLHLHLGKVDVPLVSPSAVPVLAALPAAVVALAGLAGQADRRRRNQLFGTNQSLEAVRKLAWRDFERWVAEAYRRQGFEVTETASGADGGAWTSSCALRESSPTSSASIGGHRRSTSGQGASSMASWRAAEPSAA
jgi:restriction system protein